MTELAAEPVESIHISPLAGKSPLDSMLVDVPRLVTSYYTLVPDISMLSQRVAFGTSGHRGSSYTKSFNEWHVLAITQAICDYRKKNGITGPIFVGIDTHALSAPAFASALEVLAANGMQTMVSQGDEPTPTPAVSHAILIYNRGRTSGLADGIVITPSHNPPQDGGFKYNSINGGPADVNITDWVQARANELLRGGLREVRRLPFEKAIQADIVHRHDFLEDYVKDLGNVIDMDVIRSATVHMGVDPLGGAGVHYWARIAELYRLDLTVISDQVDPTFRFMSLDWDGQIRMDPSSPYAMQRLIAQRDRFDISFACDTDHDRHGIVTKSAGLLATNHYLAVAIDYLLEHRTDWGSAAGIGKTIVSSQIIDRVAAKHKRRLVEVPVGFKWFVDGLFNSTLGFGGEESAGASFLRADGAVWTTDKDGLIAALLSAEMTAKTGRDPGELYASLTQELGAPVSQRFEAAATAEQKDKLKKITARQIHSTDMAGEKIQEILTHAPGNNASIGGVKVITESGWFAARPSGTEDIYKIYAESFKDNKHLQCILSEAQTIVNEALGQSSDDSDYCAPG